MPPGGGKPATGPGETERERKATLERWMKTDRHRERENGREIAREKDMQTDSDSVL